MLSDTHTHTTSVNNIIIYYVCSTIISPQQFAVGSDCLKQTLGH